jgi:hypothetical protein
VAAAEAAQLHVKFWVAPPGIVAEAGLAAPQLTLVAGLELGATDVTEALEAPLFLRASVSVTAWPVLAVDVDGVSVGARTAAACTVTVVPVTAELMFAPLTASAAVTVAP